MKLLLLLAASVSISASHVPEYFLIRHAEKNPDGTISALGQLREQCLVKVFSKSSAFNIQHIMVQTPYPGTSAEEHTTQRPYNTSLPLARSLGIKIDHPCNYQDTECAGKAALDYSGPGNVLIVWEHDHLPDVARAIGARHVPRYPDNRFDLIYNLPWPYKEVTVTSEYCARFDPASLVTGVSSSSPSASSSATGTESSSVAPTVATSSGIKAQCTAITSNSFVAIVVSVAALLAI